MCGIAGILRPPGRPVHAPELTAMADALAHRGPDHAGIHLDGNLGLAYRRLSILDLSPAGHQPMSNEDGSVHVVYNGQLYGFAETRDWLEGRGHRFRSHTDTEVIVHLYEERGDELLDGIDGMFAFGLWDARRRRLLLARDRLGIKPLVYIEHQGSLAFASELRALLTLPGLPRDVDPAAVVHYLYQSSVPGTRSIHRAFQKLGPGELLVAEGGTVRRRVYWSTPPPSEDRGLTLEAAARELRERLDAAVRSHLVADVPVGTFLSGGLDSSAVTLAARTAGGAPLHSFSVCFPGRAAHDEGPAAREAADALGTLHHELVLGPETIQGLPAVLALADEPFAVSSAFALHHLARFAREHVKVVLTGDGADELLGGYPWRHEPETGEGASPRSFLRGLAMAGVRSVRGARSGGPGLAVQAASRLGRLVGDPGERYAEIVAAFTPEEMDALLSPEMAQAALQAWEENPVRRAYDEEVDPDPVNRRLRADLRTSLVDEMLAKVDHMTMAASLEARVPFLDRAFVEWALRVPGRLKVSGGRGKAVLREALEPVLPAAARRAKHGFDVPLGEWLRGPLREWLEGCLSSDALRELGLQPGALQQLLEAHMQGRGDYSRKLLTVAVLPRALDAGPRPAPPDRRG
jgi:asparagine synthase (glutamine-hydrolysing)